MLQSIMLLYAYFGVRCNSKLCVLSRTTSRDVNYVDRARVFVTFLLAVILAADGSWTRTVQVVRCSGVLIRTFLAPTLISMILLRCKFVIPNKIYFRNYQYICLSIPRQTASLYMERTWQCRRFSSTNGVCNCSETAVTAVIESGNSWHHSN